MIGAAAMAGTSFITGGCAIPFIASIAATYATSTVVNTVQQEEQKNKYIEKKIKIVKEAFEEYKKNKDITIRLGDSEDLSGEEMKSFLEDIYICDSEDIIHLEDDRMYTWKSIESSVKLYEEKELENV